MESDKNVMKRNISGLHLKYRPKDFDEVIGNEAAVKSLQSILKRKKEKIPHVFMFIADYGSGKTSFARIVAKYLGCSEHDLKEMDVGTDRGVKSADDLKSILKYAPMEGDVRVIILDEIQESSAKYMGSLLKTLEDGCPNHIYFIICTTNPEKINRGIMSRASKHLLKPLSVLELTELIKRVCRKEKRELPEPIIQRVAESSDGSPRNSLTLLDSIIDLKDYKDIRAVLKSSEEIILMSRVEDENVLELCKALIRGDSRKIIMGIKKKIKVTPETTRITVFNYFGAVLENSPKGNPLASVVMEYLEKPFYLADGKHRLTLALDRILSL